MLTLLGTVAAPAWAQAQPPGPLNASHPKWGGYVDVEAKPGSKRTLGEIDLFVPLAQDSSTLFFGNLRGRFADSSSREGNFGLGVRRMLDNGWNVGLYGYIDRRHTPQGSSFGQITLGVEALGRDWDWRANTYNPYGSRVNNLGASGASTATLSGTTIQVNSPGLSEERALGGYDAEAGWRLPVFGADDAKQLRVYLGGYRFSDNLARVAGTRLRAEFIVAELPQLWKGAQMTLGAEVQNDNARGSQHLVSLRLRIPFGGSAASARRLTTQEQRMTAPVVRDVDIVTQVVTGAPTVETASALAGGQGFTVLSSDSTTGANLPGAVAAAGANSTVVLSGTFNTNAITQLQPGQTLMGTGQLSVRTPSGKVATFNAPGATITGAIPGNNGSINMANHSTLTGMNISNVSTGGGTPNPRGVNVEGVSNARIINNNISVTENLAGGSSQGILIFNNSSNILVTGNRFTIIGTSIAVGVNVVDSSATVTNNTLSATGSSGGNSRATRVFNANILPGSTGNTIVNGICEVAVGGTGSQIGFTNAASCGP